MVISQHGQALITLEASEAAAKSAIAALNVRVEVAAAHGRTRAA